MDAKDIGLDAASSLIEVGPRSDIIGFVRAIERYAAPRWPGEDWSIITDRFYRRYIARAELDRFVHLLTLAREAFTAVPVRAVDWSAIGLDWTKTCMATDGQTLLSVFAPMFRKIDSGVESVRGWDEDFGQYRALKVIRLAMPESQEDMDRPLEELDALEGEPFWMEEPPSGRPPWRPSVVLTPEGSFVYNEDDELEREDEFFARHEAKHAAEEAEMVRAKTPPDKKPRKP